MKMKTVYRDDDGPPSNGEAAASYSWELENGMDGTRGAIPFQEQMGSLEFRSPLAYGEAMGFP